MAKKRKAPAVSPTSQSASRTVLERQPDESQADWECALAEIEAGGQAVVTRLADGTACIKWPAEAVA